MVRNNAPNERAAAQHDPRTDAELLAAIAASDPDALVALYDRYGRLAFGLAYRILGDAFLAEEVVQDAFMNVWRNAAKFDANRGAVRSWLLAIVHHRAVDRLREWRGKAPEVNLDDAALTLAAPDVWGALLDQLELESVQQALAALPEEQRLALELAYFQGLTHQEIAERTGWPLGTVKSRLRLGLAKLADLLAPLRTPGDQNARG